MSIEAWTRAPHDLWIVVPASGIARGKSRLSPVLSASERWRLNEQLLRRTVRTAQAVLSGGARCLVISPCERSRVIARAEGAMPLVEVRPRRGLNAALGQAIRFAARRGARRILVLPVDLPGVRAASLASVLRAARAGAQRIVVPDRDAEGTNVLVIPARPGIDLHFGADSFERHLRSARDAGRNAFVVSSAALMQDIDTPAHFHAWRVAGRAVR